MVSYADRLFRFQINRLVKVRQLPRDDSRGLKRKASGGSRASAMRSRSRSRYPTSSDPGASSSSKDASRKNFSRRSGGGGGSKMKRGSGAGGSKAAGESMSLTSWFSASDRSPAVTMVAQSGLDPSMALSLHSLPPGGRISKAISNWRMITADKKVLRIVSRGYKLQFCRSPPKNFRGRNPVSPSDPTAAEVLDKEISQIVEKGAGVPVQSQPLQIISGIFIRPKKTPGKWRPCINVKYLNRFLHKVKFACVKLSLIRDWIKPGYYMASLDLADAYYSVPLAPSAFKYCRFSWRGVLYEYRTLFFGLTSSPRIFSKILHLVVLYLRDKFGMLVIAYLDDILVQAPSAELCSLHMEILVIVISSLGYAVSFDKSELVPAQVREYLGLLWHSDTMTVSLPEAKRLKIVATTLDMLRAGSVSVRALRSLLGYLEAARHAVPLAPLHFRNLQLMLRPHIRVGHRLVNPDRLLAIDAGGGGDLTFWSELTPASTAAPLRSPAAAPDVTIATDASGSIGFGGHSSAGGFFQGVWADTPAWVQEGSINLKELYATVLAVKNLMPHGASVLLHVDNSSAVSYVNRQGGQRSSSLNRAAQLLWREVLRRGGWVSAKWVPRDLNQCADLLSKADLDCWEVSLLPDTLRVIWDTWFTPTIDLFASALCHVRPSYCSMALDSNSLGNAFSLVKWPAVGAYAFPPTPIISSVLDRVLRDQVRKIILVVPHWTGALWWPRLARALLAPPLALPPARVCLRQMAGLRTPVLDPLLACLVTGSRLS